MNKKQKENFSHCSLEQIKFIKKLLMWNKLNDSKNKFYNIDIKEEEFREMLKFLGFVDFKSNEQKELFFHPIGFILNFSTYKGDVTSGNVHFVGASIVDDPNKKNNYSKLSITGGFEVNRYGIVSVVGDLYFGQNTRSVSNAFFDILSNTFLLSQLPVEFIRSHHSHIFSVRQDGVDSKLDDFISNLPSSVLHYINKDEFVKYIKKECTRISNGEKYASLERDWLWDLKDELYSLEEKNEPEVLENAVDKKINKKLKIK